jgi:hypothetical protein
VALDFIACCKLQVTSYKLQVALDFIACARAP